MTNVFNIFSSDVVKADSLERLFHVLLPIFGSVCCGKIRLKISDDFFVDPVFNIITVSNGDDNKNEFIKKVKSLTPRANEDKDIYEFVESLSKLEDDQQLVFYTNERLEDNFLIDFIVQCKTGSITFTTTKKQYNLTGVHLNSSLFLNDDQVAILENTFLSHYLLYSPSELTWNYNDNYILEIINKMAELAHCLRGYVCALSDNALGILKDYCTEDSIYDKKPTFVCRIALIIHCLESTSSPVSPFGMITTEQLIKALEIYKMYERQTALAIAKIKDNRSTGNGNA